MFIRSIQLTNIRSIADLEWVPYQSIESGWHVIIGDNGSGKSTFLRAVALSLIGYEQAPALGQNWNNWLRSNSESGTISVSIGQQPQYDKFALDTGKKALALYADRYSFPLHLHFRKEANIVRLGTNNSQLNPMYYTWGNGEGWFSASYGPFRRFSGSDLDDEATAYTSPKIARHLSLFRESAALTECLSWLKELKFKKLEKKPEGRLLDQLTEFVNQAGFLPYHARLHDVTSDGVTFVDGNGCTIPIEDLSDGYRSILSLTFELIRQLARTYGPDNIFAKNDPTKIIVPGVVLIDEVDVHLHPTWQRRVGLWFREHFPHIQFIVTTHSPLVCQAADMGTVFRLPKPGTDEIGSMVTGGALDRLLYGNVLDAYSTELFGEDVTRSEESKRRLERLAQLNIKELRENLSESERGEQTRLRAALPTTAHTLAPLREE